MTTAYVIYNGPHDLNLTPAQGKLIDAQQGSAQGYRTDRDGYEEAEAELLQGYPTAGAAAGIPQDVFDHFVATNETVEFIDENLVIARKQVEVLEESRAFYVDARQNDIAIMCDSMRSKAQRRKDPSILTPFEKTLAYQSATGVKAAKTRKLNAIKAKEEAAAQATTQTVAQAEIKAAVEAEVESYKAELKAKFDEAVTLAVQSKIAEIKEKAVA
jgi:hypothetical protein